MNHPIAVAIFVVVYAGMMLGRIPGLALDRTGVAILGAIAMVTVGPLEPEQAWAAIDVSTLMLLFGLMIVSAQFRLGGFYSRSTRWLGSLTLSAPRLLAAIMFGSALLSAALANDVVCLAATPALIDVCARRRLNPLPFLIGLACASNIGSAATLIGNPQNILIGQSLDLGFARYGWIAAPPTLVSLLVAWSILCYLTRGRWVATTRVDAGEVDAGEDVPFDRWQTGKAAVVLISLVVLFFSGLGHREVFAVAAAGLLLLSRRTASRTTLALVDWELLLLFIGLFVVHAGLAVTGTPAQALDDLARAGVDLREPAWLFAASAVLSNVVSNVPAVMLLLPATSDVTGGSTMALASTLAGNFIIVGSIANLIVVDQAQRRGVRITWREHARYGVPITIATLAVTAGWLAATLW